MYNVLVPSHHPWWKQRATPKPWYNLNCFHALIQSLTTIFASTWSNVGTMTY